MRAWLRVALFAGLGASVAVACLVPDVALEHRDDEQEGGSGNGAGGKSSGGNATSAGKGNAADSGEPSTAGGDDSGNSSAGGSDGGSASAGGGGSGGGSLGGGGSAGKGGGGGGGVTFPTNPCANPGLFCDDFETADLAAWPSGDYTRPTITDAPSGQHVMQTGFHAVPSAHGKDLSSFTLSFWVRFPTTPDQGFITWSTSLTGRELFFGVEAAGFRFRLNGDPAQHAPEAGEQTRPSVIDTWTCIELDVEDGGYQATVTVLGQQPKKLGFLGGTADAGIDKQLLESVPGGKVTLLPGGTWTFGEPGTDIQLDVVRIDEFGQPSVCDEFNAANP
jgi:hypothetical protein